MKIDLPPQYDPKTVEKPIYEKWLAARAFHAVPDARANRYSIVIPPPNVTGALHLGHAINGTLQDILTRYHRMKGDNTLWMPGIDHAGIATQAVVEKTIFEKEQKNRHDLGREELVRRIWEWKEQFGSRILTQLASIGASCDWDRTRFTLDDVCAKAVREAFFKMFKDGLIFRGKRLVNWDTHLQTAVADDEIYYEPVKGQLTSIKYPVEGKGERGEGEEFLVVATTRPETMLGDTAVAVHPDDPRYKHLIGQHVILPLVGRRIPIIADGLLVDPKFGTGVVKVTPAHDPNDYATGQRHNLEQINLLTPDGKVNENGQGEFRGIKYSYTGQKFATEARKRVLADLEGLGLIADKKPHDHEVGHSDRSKTPIEPYLSDQWFVRMGDIEPGKTEPRPSGSDCGATEPRPSGSGNIPYHSSAHAYFITFHTYSTWVRGDAPSAVDDEHNIPGTPFVPPDEETALRERSHSAHSPVVLSLAQRASICNTIQEVATHRGWTIHALSVRSTHVHVVVSGAPAPERMMNDFKSYATRRLREAGLVSDDTAAKVWSRHGSTRYLWKSEDTSAAAKYTLAAQGENAPGTTCALRQTQPLPDGRGSDGGSVLLGNGQRASGLAQAAMDAVTDGRVKITPERYAKGYLDWLGQKRDWCISRQLWWGHRIPVWSSRGAISGWGDEVDKFMAKITQWRLEGRIAEDHRKPSEAGPGGLIEAGLTNWHLCVRSEDDREAIAEIEKAGFTRDPDVLDTWFSSALWPISTMGWPEDRTYSEPRPSGSGSDPSSRPSRPLPDGRGSDGMRPEPELLPYFYPTSLLSTAREILTLWVARMVMFGLYCKGDVPFRRVYIHPVVQDGEGRPMKKSLGNGLDPVDIVESHGADALRFTMAAMATETQDVRMPLVKDPKTGHNTSPKFDIGRNFANKIWNASRFILGNIGETRPLETGNRKLETLEDRWILSRLHSTIRATEDRINNYQFAELAQGLYQFFWTDLCDWYLEIAKARIKSGDAAVQSILLECLRTTLKLLHPLMPFITEELWSKLPPEKPEAGAMPSGAGAAAGMLITAPWPAADAALIDPAAETQIGLVQQITSAIREIQNRYPGAKGKDVVIKSRDARVQQLVEASRGVIETLAGAKIAENSPAAAKPANAATSVLPEAEIYIGGAVDRVAESAKLAKRRDELLKFIAGNKAKLGNEAFVGKAPAKVVQGLRDQLASQEAELAAVEKNLAEL